MAAEAMACSATIFTACTRTKGSWLQGGTGRELSTNTTDLPEPMSVAVIDSDSKPPISQLRETRLPGDEAAHDPLEHGGVDDAAQPLLPLLDLLDLAAAEQGGGRLHELLDPEVHHLLEDEALPALGQQAPLGGRRCRRCRP